ncbi:MAG: sigma factor-like helix-turn-helix DNA-binding protein [Clostridia bacterium]
MFYYEGYSAKETASYLGKTESSVWGYLHKGRSLLKLVLREAH